MFCSTCGAKCMNSDRFCTECGSPMESVPLPTEEKKDDAKNESKNKQLVGYSPKINDSAFARYQKHTKIWSLGFGAVLALAAIVGFFIYGQNSTEMDNPEALFIGFGIGAMFMLIAIFQVAGKSRTTTWDGVVVDKKYAQKRRKQRSGDDDWWENYEVYTVMIKKDNGKIHELRTENDDTVYNYYQIGDKVRHHKGLNTLEKYDKSGDAIIFCNACASLNDIQNDKCFRCSCPLLK